MKLICVFFSMAFCVLGQKANVGIRFLTTEVQNEFIAKLSVDPLVGMYLDIDNSYISMVNNHDDSIDNGIYKVIHLQKDDSALYGRFGLEEFNPNKFVRTHLVFRDSFGKIVFTQSEYFEMTIADRLRICYEENFVRVYFCSSNSESGQIYNLLGQKLAIIEKISSGDLLPTENLPAGIYFLEVKNLDVKKFLKRW